MTATQPWVTSREQRWVSSRERSSLDRLVRTGVFPSRSRAIQDAVQERLRRLSRDRLARECAKLDPVAEAHLADEGMALEPEQWPEY